MRDSIYYRVTGGSALEFCRKYRKSWRETEDKWNEYAGSKGGIGHVRLGDRTFGGVVFSREPEKTNGWKKYKRNCPDGTSFYVPIQRGKGNEAGRVLQAEFDALDLGPDAKDICDVIGFPQEVHAIVNGDDRTFGVTSFFNPVQIAWPDQTDTFFVVLPDVNETIRTCVDGNGEVLTPEWIVPQGLEASSRKRYELAVAEAAVRAEDNA